MKYLFLFIGVFFIAATANAQDTKVTQLPPVRTVDKTQPQLQKTGVSLPVLATANVSAPKPISSAQAVPLRTSDIATTVSPAPAAVNTPAGKAALQPPSSISVKQAMEQRQKQDSTGKTAQ